VSWNREREQYRPIRPRPGKQISAVSCRDLPAMIHLQVLEVEYELELRVQGGYRGTVVRGNTLVLDSGYRYTKYHGYGDDKNVCHISQGLPVNPVWSEKVERVEGMYVYPTMYGPIISPTKVHADVLPMVVTGGKVLIVSENSTCGIVQDVGKAWDSLGGKIEAGESSVSCVVREFREETKGLEIDPEDLVYVGVSSAKEKHKGRDHEYHSMMFLMPYNKIDPRFPSRIPVKWIKSSLEIPNDSVPWLRRLITHCEKEVGPISTWWDWLQMKLSRKKIQPKNLKAALTMEVMQSTGPVVESVGVYNGVEYKFIYHKGTLAKKLKQDLWEICGFQSKVRFTNGDEVSDDYEMKIQTYYYLS